MANVCFIWEHYFSTSAAYLISCGFRTNPSSFILTLTYHYFASISLNVEWQVEYFLARTLIFCFGSVIWHSVMASQRDNPLSTSLHCVCIAFGICEGGGNKSVRKHCWSVTNEHISGATCL